MKKYKTMYTIEENGDINEIAVSSITKDGWIKYYPIIDGKPYKFYGVKYSKLNSVIDNIEKAHEISKQKKFIYINKKMKETEFNLGEKALSLQSLKSQYLRAFTMIKESQNKLAKNIEEYKKQIKELEGE